MSKKEEGMDRKILQTIDFEGQSIPEIEVTRREVRRGDQMMIDREICQTHKTFCRVRLKSDGDQWGAATHMVVTEIADGCRSRQGIRIVSRSLLN